MGQRHSKVNTITPTKLAYCDANGQFNALIYVKEKTKLKNKYRTLYKKLVKYWYQIFITDKDYVLQELLKNYQEGIPYVTCKLPGPLNPLTLTDSEMTQVLKRVTKSSYLLHAIKATYGPEFFLIVHQSSTWCIRLMWRKIPKLTFWKKLRCQTASKKSVKEEEELSDTN
jgi:hypothetical protein